MFVGYAGRFDTRAPVEGDTMAEYLLLIYGDESKFEKPDPKAMEAMMEGHRVFGEKNGALLRGGNALEPSHTATSIRGDSPSGFTTTDGAFAETKEALGGYYVVEAADLDEAIVIAKGIPMPFGGVEVRPIRVMD
jgi:hypothetical protein